MSPRGTVPSEPDPAWSAELADAAVRAVEVGPDAVRQVALDAFLLDVLLDVVRGGGSTELTALEGRLPHGPYPLLGRRAGSGAFESFRWNGAAMRRGALKSSGGYERAVAVGGLVAAIAGGASGQRLVSAVGSGLAVCEAVRDRFPSDRGIRDLTTVAVVGVATTCALLEARTVLELAAIVDLAGSLMVITSEQGGGPSTAPDWMWAGHGCAAGALAVHLFDRGITPLNGGLAHHLSLLASHDADQQLVGLEIGGRTSEPGVLNGVAGPLAGLGALSGLADLRSLTSGLAGEDQEDGS